MLQLLPPELLLHVLALEDLSRSELVDLASVSRHLAACVVVQLHTHIVLHEEGQALALLDDRAFGRNITLRLYMAGDRYEGGITNGTAEKVLARVKGLASLELEDFAAFDARMLETKNLSRQSFCSRVWMQADYLPVLTRLKLCTRLNVSQGPFKFKFRLEQLSTGRDDIPAGLERDLFHTTITSLAHVDRATFHPGVGFASLDSPVLANLTSLDLGLALCRDYFEENLVSQFLALSSLRILHWRDSLFPPEKVIDMLSTLPHPTLKFLYWTTPHYITNTGYNLCTQLLLLPSCKNIVEFRTSYAILRVEETDGKRRFYRVKETVRNED